MTAEPAAPLDSAATGEPVRPAYGHSTIGEILPAIGAHLGVPECSDDPLGLPAASRYVVVLVDGLGWHLVRGAARSAPYFASLLGDARTITAGAPSTTATSLTSLGTGLAPGQHGMVGYAVRVPETGEILNTLSWDSAVDARAFQPKATVFERAARAGVAVTSVTLERFAGSGLTVAALRGSQFVGVPDRPPEEERVARTVAAACRGDRSLVYAYLRDLDHCGHGSGCASPRWVEHLSRIDGLCERLREALPAEVALIITGDHGMVDVPPAEQILVEDEPSLQAGVSALAGEGRFRQLYVDQEAPARVATRWADRLGSRAWVRTRDEATDEGWFGPVDPALRNRYGHVLVAMRGRSAVMSRQYPRELNLIGMHGSLTAEEMLVPLFVD